MDAEVYPHRRELEAMRREVERAGGGVVWVHEPDCKGEFGQPCDCEPERVEVEAGE